MSLLEDFLAAPAITQIVVVIGAFWLAWFFTAVLYFRRTTSRPKEPHNDRD